jgi:hypothetical protein
MLKRRSENGHEKEKKSVSFALVGGHPLHNEFREKREQLRKNMTMFSNKNQRNLKTTRELSASRNSSLNMSLKPEAIPVATYIHVTEDTLNTAIKQLEKLPAHAVQNKFFRDVKRFSESEKLQKRFGHRFHDGPYRTEKNENLDVLKRHSKELFVSNRKMREDRLSHKEMMAERRVLREKKYTNEYLKGLIRQALGNKRISPGIHSKIITDIDSMYRIMESSSSQAAANASRRLEREKAANMFNLDYLRATLSRDPCAKRLCEVKKGVLSCKNPIHDVTQYLSRYYSHHKLTPPNPTDGVVSVQLPQEVTLLRNVVKQPLSIGNRPNKRFLDSASEKNQVFVSGTESGSPRSVLNQKGDFS